MEAPANPSCGKILSQWSNQVRASSMAICWELFEICFLPFLLLYDAVCNVMRNCWIFRLHFSKYFQLNFGLSENIFWVGWHTFPVFFSLVSFLWYSIRVLVIFRRSTPGNFRRVGQYFFENLEQKLPRSMETPISFRSYTFILHSILSLV